jgi:hypothetical protein
MCYNLAGTMALAVTPLDLYRAGNKSSPRFEHYRYGDFVIQPISGRDWVRGPKQGGASTLEVPIGLRGTWYLLPKGTGYDDAILFLWNDYPGHWSWEPAQDMLLVNFLDALKGLNTSFVRMP